MISDRPGGYLADVGQRRPTSLVEIVGMNKWYGDFHVLRDINLTRHARRAHRHLRAVRLGQVDPDPLHQSARGAPEGP